MQVDRLCLFLHFCLHCTGVLHQTPALGSVYSCAFVFSVWECFIGPQHLAVFIVALLSSAYRSASSDPNTWQWLLLHFCLQRTGVLHWTNTWQCLLLRFCLQRTGERRRTPTLGRLAPSFCTSPPALCLLAGPSSST